MMKRPHYREGASGWESLGVVTAAQHSLAPRDRPFRAERPEGDPELYRGSLYEPSYSIWEAAVGVTVIVIGSLLSQWLWGQ
jgi:hypothetical protein